MVAHGGIIEIELVVGEHEACVVALGSLDSPWRVDMNHFKMAHLLNQVIQIEETEITVYVSLGTKAVLLSPIRTVTFLSIQQHNFSFRLYWYFQLNCIYRLIGNHITRLWE